MSSSLNKFFLNDVKFLGGLIHSPRLAKKQQEEDFVCKPREGGYEVTDREGEEMEKHERTFISTNMRLNKKLSDNYLNIRVGRMRRCF